MERSNKWELTRCVWRTWRGLAVLIETAFCVTVPKIKVPLASLSLNFGTGVLDEYWTYKNRRNSMEDNGIL
jgi:hypothetical protein